MSKQTTVAALIAGFFGRSEKAISEKLSTEEHNEFSADVSELNEKLETANTENARISTELATAATRITELEASLSTASVEVTTMTASLATVTTERDKYKGHYDEAAKKGEQNAGQDANSRGASGKAVYNENAIAVWQKAQA
ncbi:hypothetical protein [Dyadobacter sp. CY343]|uniref:hypothetical protein n=1 Tax=Dyadobacter sp. CY343 TaxID=2907299 RepID=UPI001F262D1B|nr:hypothetical protein [Dyadobacter sp. CY343]MCE7061261.1 hypothetical protein [Dyadobacter sp. CY343]